MTASLHADAGARALDALPAVEAEAFDEHVSVCESCAAEYQEFLATTAMLAAAVAAAPPDRLHERVLRAAARTPQLPPLTETAESSGEEPHLGAGPAGHHRRRTAWWRRLALVAAAVVVVAALVSAAVIVATHRDGPSPEQVAAQCVAAASDAEVRHPAVGSGGSVTLARSCDAAVVHVAALPTLPTGRAYQLWVLAGSKARSEGMVAQRMATSGQILVTGLGPSDTDIGISVEPAGGSATPTTKPVWVVPLTS